MVKGFLSFKFIVFVLALLAAAGAGWWWFQLHHYSVRESIDAGIIVLQDAGPWVFFIALAILPAVGFPVSFFYLAAGTVFAERMSLGGVLAATGLALLTNLSLTYWLARYGIRPWLIQIISRTKYKIPVVAPAEQAEITLLLRITPGPPFFVQGCLLGLAEIRFSTYLWISWVVAMPYATGFIIFGDAILHGKGRLAFLGLSALVAVALIVHMLRKHYGKKKDTVKKTDDMVLDDAGRVQTVTEFTRRVKELLKGGLPPCWVRGEISNLRIQSSGHVYFSLKDAGAQLSCVLFRGDAIRQSVQLRDGLQVMAYGEVDVYESRGQYQLITRALIEQGAGKLQQEFEKLKKRLADEGLFEPTRKQPLPLMPRTIGFITSPTGAAVQDFIRILQRRGWHGRLVVLPAKVQGEGAADEMAALLRTAETLGVLDLLVIGRGGGSIEDLWAFNEESLVRAVAACAVPIISAVGHEIDYTLCDFAADVRAETPSGAAELISSNFISATERVQQAGGAMLERVEQSLARGSERLDHARSRLRLLSPAAQIEQGHLRLDDMAGRLNAALRQAIQQGREQLAGARARLASASPEKRVQLESHRLLALWKRLESSSPQSVLNRGYAIVRDEQGRPIARAKGLKAGQILVNEFHDGQVRVHTE